MKCNVGIYNISAAMLLTPCISYIDSVNVDTYQVCKGYCYKNEFATITSLVDMIYWRTRKFVQKTSWYDPTPA